MPLTSVAGAIKAGKRAAAAEQKKNAEAAKAEAERLARVHREWVAHELKGLETGWVLEQIKAAVQQGQTSCCLSMYEENAFHHAAGVADAIRQKYPELRVDYREEMDYLNSDEVKELITSVHVSWNDR